MKRACRVAALAAVMMLFAAGQIFAASDYGYQITIYPGNQGTFEDNAVGMLYCNAAGDDVIKYGETVTLDVNDIKVNLDQEKYYVKGLREAGTDNSDPSFIQSRTIKVKRDMAYVVAYGMRQNMVKYTVKYLDENGEELLPAGEYYGSVGDKPTVSFKYVKGYLPNAYNEEKTLKANEAENVFPFVYHKVETPAAEKPEQKAEQPTQAEQPKADQPKDEQPASGSAEKKKSKSKPKANDNDRDNDTGNTVRYVASGNNQAAANQAANNGTANDQNAAGNQTAGNQTDSGSNDSGSPAELVDLDDNDVPLASAPSDKEGKSSGKHTAAILRIVIGALAVLAIVVLVVIRRRRSDA